MKIQVLNSYLAANTTFYAAVQSRTGAGALVLNYAALNADANIVVSTSEWNRKVTFTSVANNSATNVTIIGNDVFGNIVTEVLAGSNNNTVTSIQYYSTITSLITNGNITNMSVGFGISAQSLPFKMSMNVSKAQWAVQTVVGGTINYDLQYTLFPFENYTSPPTFDFTNNWLNIPIIAPGGNTGIGTVIAALTTSQYLNFAAPVYAIRFVINSGTAPTFQAFIAQQGTL
jgi:hypothetical protein